MEKLVLDKRMKRLLIVAGLLIFAACPAMAQISYKTTDRHEQLKRKSLREASQADASYKDTHLNMEAYNFKKGESGKADNRPFLQLFGPKHDTAKEAVQRGPADQGKKKFRLFRKKETK